MVDRVDEDLAVADLAGLGGAGDGIDDLVDLVGGDSHFDLELGQEADGVFRAAEKDRTLRGMGSTLVAALILGKDFIAANVGDSRMYQFHNKTLFTVTTDHSLVEQLVLAGAITKDEARVHPQRNIITRAMGVAPSVDVDLFERLWVPGDILLICSDGLHGAVEEEDIITVLSSGRSLESMCDVLVQFALDNGGTDNITVILVRLEEGDVV